MPEKTLGELATEVHTATAALTELLSRYPDRNEVERRFVSRSTSRNRMFLVLVMVIVAMLVSAFITVSTVSVCFLGGQNSDPGICHIMPGYSKAVQQNKVLLKQFKDLVNITQTNQKRIARLEKQNASH